MISCNVWQTARALSIMNQRYLTDVLGRNPTVEPEVVVDTLTTIWVRTLYGDRASPAPPGTRARAASSHRRSR